MTHLLPHLTHHEIVTLSHSLPNRLANKSVMVGISGGVDSALSLRFVKEFSQAKSIQALWMNNWDHSDDDTGLCSIQAETDWKHAQRVCESLQVPLEKVDFTHEYWNQVWKPSLKLYAKGNTPNPDVSCNREIKFGTFLQYAKLKTGDANNTMLVMGHYARNYYCPHPQHQNNNTDNSTTTTTTILRRGLDANKDQSYFLSTVQAQVLFQHACFPLGEFHKTRIKQLAELCGWNFLARKKESFGVCFIGDKHNFSEFLDQYLPPISEARYRIVGGGGSSKSVHTNNNNNKQDLGRVYGFSSLTTGKRARIPGMKIPYYVVSKDVENQIVWVSPNGDESLLSKGVIVENFNWLLLDSQQKQQPQHFRAQCQVRYRSQPISCQVEVVHQHHHHHNNNTLHITFDKSHERAAIGQIAALYDIETNQQCLGGGMIVDTL
jgi:tRNA (5-methylaminomethyl-2-thiouridylate)-methyltransferase